MISESTMCTTCKIYHPKTAELHYRSVNFEMLFGCPQFSPEDERKQVNLRFHSSKVELVRVFLEETSAWKNSFDFVRPLGTVYP